MTRGRPDGSKHAIQIDFDHPIPALVRIVLESAFSNARSFRSRPATNKPHSRIDAGIGKDNIKPTVDANGAINSCVERLVIGNIYDLTNRIVYVYYFHDYDNAVVLDLEEELAKHNLVHRFSFLISSIDYVFRKPHRRLFQIAVKKMNLAPQDIWFVGDKLEYDIRGAIDYGLYPVWYNPEGKPGEIDDEYLEVRSWHEFREEIESVVDR